MSDTVEKIKERLTIVDVVQAYVKVTRAGKYWKGLSPFTKEKTPSFFLSPDKGLYHCFSTGKGGDMFTFVEEMEGVDFKGALKILAEKAGVELVHESKESKDERDQLYAALEAATVFYESALGEMQDAREYLVGRGLEPGTIAHWRIGYAPKDWRALKDHLLQKGFAEATLIAAGLVKRPDREDGSTDEKRTYDRFRGRIMFPIFDASGRVIAFSGRIFEDDPSHPQAKYLNSPEGVLFDKSRALYGLQDAKHAVRTLGFSMLVEGQVDLLMAHQLGFRSAVATSGTAFTASHVEVLKRYSQNVLLSYDGDKAGVNATYRAALLLLDAGLNVKVVALPAGSDPAELILKDSAGFKDCVRKAQPVIDFFVSHFMHTVVDERARLLELSKIVVPLIAKIQNALEQAHAIQRMAEAARIPEEALRAELKKIVTVGVREELERNPFFAEDAREKLLFGILRTYEDALHPATERVRAAYVSAYGESALALARGRSASEEEAARILASENFFQLYQTLESEANALSVLLLEERGERQRRKGEFDDLRRALKKAEGEGDTAEVTRLMALLGELSKKLE